MKEQGRVRLRRAARGLADLLAPAGCADCGAWLPNAGTSRWDALDALCPGCLERLPWRPRGPACALCQTALTAAAANDLARCASCAASDSALAGCLASLDFRGEAERWIHRLKYPAPGLRGLDPRPAAVIRTVARDLARRAAACVRDGAWVIPIPLHPRRLRQRGFNPALLVAREIARSADLPLEARWLVRVRDTPSQTGLGRRERRHNLAAAFACRGPGAPRLAWLVDDVVTTGATLQEAARCLRAAGVEEVLALCAARTPPAIEVREATG